MFDPEVCAIEPDLIAWRRHMHQNPEVSFEETQTTEYLEDFLRCFGVDAIDRPTKISWAKSPAAAPPSRFARISTRCRCRRKTICRIAPVTRA